MAAMTTPLSEFSTTGNSRTMILSSHTAVKPRLVIQKRKVASVAGSVAEDTVDVVYATEDSNGDSLTPRVSFKATVRRPENGTAADVTAALALFREIVASDEFQAIVDQQAFIA